MTSAVKDGQRENMQTDKKRAVIFCHNFVLSFFVCCNNNENNTVCTFLACHKVVPSDHVVTLCCYEPGETGEFYKNLDVASTPWAMKFSWWQDDL